MKEPEDVHAANTCRPGGSARIVYQHRIGNVGVQGEGARVVDVPGSDRDDFGSKLTDVVVAVAQLRGVLTAVQSAEVTREDEHHLAVGP